MAIKRGGEPLLARPRDAGIGRPAGCIPADKGLVAPMRVPAVGVAGDLLRGVAIRRDAYGPDQAWAPIAVVHVIDVNADVEVIGADHLAATDIDRRVREPGMERIGKDQ